MDSLSKRLFDDEFRHYYLKMIHLKKRIIVISSDRGLCGGFNANLFKKTRQGFSDISQC